MIDMRDGCKHVPLKDMRAYVRNTLTEGRERSLANCDLSRADLAGEKLNNVDFRGCRLNHADLRQVDFRGALHLSVENIAGADLRSCLMPEMFSIELEPVNESVRNCRSLSIMLLLASIYIVLAAAGTNDADLLTASRTFKLPVIGAEISLTGFYVMGPISLLLFSLYFYLNTERLFERLSRLPAALPDGSIIDEAVSPWIATGLIRWRQPILRQAISGIWLARSAIGAALMWIVVPTTLSFFWLRYLKRHEAIVTSLHIVLIAISVVLSVWFCYLCCTGRRPSVRALAVIVVGALFFFIGPAMYVSITVLGVGELPTAVAAVLNYAGYRPNLDLTGAIVSRRPANWSPALDPNHDEVTGADLAHASLRNATGRHVFLARANLTQADLRSAYLSRGRFQFANLTAMDAQGANFIGANFRSAHFHGAFVQNANLSDAQF